MSGAEAKEFTKADAAKAVKRAVPVFGEDKKQKRDGKGELVFKPVAVEEKEVLDFIKKEDGTVIVVTVDGQKLTGEA